MDSRQPGLGTQLRRLLALLDGDVQTIYEELGFPFRPRFYPVTRLLLEVGSESVSGIARLTGVTQPAATQTIREMRALGLVRVSAGEDRRARRVSLTDKGIRLAAEMRPIWEAVERAAAALESELPAGLAPVLDAAIAALDREPFGRRIHALLSKGRPTR